MRPSKDVFTTAMLAMVLLASVHWPVDPVWGQNSTRKNRVTPNSLSQRVGTGVKWSSSLEEAQQRSKKSGKPVFWYVSSVPGTFMDRKAEINVYMLGGLFSWPPIIEMLNQHFVPVREKPKPRKNPFDLLPYQFVEPGFLIIDPAGKVIAKVDRLTTLHYQWLSELLAEKLASLGKTVKIPAAPGFFDSFSKSSDQWIDPNGPDFPKNTTNLLLSGMIAFRKGKHAAAKQKWLKASQAEPEHPLAWKAALEAQGIGPFVRGFETYRKLKPEALRAGIDSAGSSAPKGTYTKSEMLALSVDFLLGMQREDGAFTDSDYDFGGTDSLPNVHVAVTSLVGMALLAARPTAAKQKERIESALQRINRFVSDNGNINLADRDEILWAHAYRLRFLARLRQDKRFVNLHAAVAKELSEATLDLENIQLKTGNWYHEYNNPFVTATALCALHEAQTAGAPINRDKINRGVESLLRDRKKNGAYPYYSSRRSQTGRERDLNQLLQASAGRMPVCELSLVLWKQKNQKDLLAAVTRSLDNHRHLASGYKYDNHTSNMAYGGFFFWYDMRGRSEAIRGITDRSVRDSLMQRQQKLIMNLPELDGCFVDSHELGRCYGTAMAILSMQ